MPFARWACRRLTGNCDNFAFFRAALRATAIAALRHARRQNIRSSQRNFNVKSLRFRE
jgi:hypothetical protein